MVASSTEMNVKKAEAVPSKARVLKVRGIEAKKHITATIALNPMVQTECPVMVLRYFAPVKTCRPWMNVLFSKNMIAVRYHAHFCPQKSICPMSHTSLTSGWRRQNSQRTKEV